MSCNVPCPPSTPPSGDQSCLPPPPPICQDAKTRAKPVMRHLHWTQTKGILAQACALSLLGGTIWFFTVVQPRRRRYREFYDQTDLEEWAEEMAQKGLFQAVPKPT